MGGNQANIKSSLFLEIVVVLAAIILVLFYVFFSLQNREEEEKTRIENILKTVLDLENHGLESWYKDKKNHIEDVTATPTVINYTKRLIQLKQANTNLLTDPIQQEIRTYFQPILEKRNYLGIFIISPYYISLSSMRDQNLGVKNYLFDKREAQVKKAFEGETVLITPLLSDVKLKKDNTQTMFILSPIKDENGQVIAVFSFRLDPDRSLSSYTELSWYGKTSQTYAFDNQGAIITGTRLSSLNKDNANRENFNPDSVKSTTLASSLAITGDSGVNLEGYEDYFGNVVYGAWLWNKQLNIGLVSEINKKEAMHYYNKYKQSVVLAALIIIIFLIVLGILVHINRTTKNQLVNSLQNKMSTLETSLGLFVSNAPVGIAINNMDGKFLEINDEFSRFTGYTIDELNKLSYWDITPEEYEIDEQVQIHQLETTGKYGPYEKQYIHKRGYRYDVLLHGVRVKDENGEELIWSIVQDISHIKKKETELIIQEEKYRTLVSNLPGVVFRCKFDEAYTMLFISDHIKDIVGYPSSDFINNHKRTFSSIIHPDDLAFIETEITRSLNKKSHYDIQYRFIDINDNIKWVHERGVVIKNEKNEPIYIDGFLKDITDRITAETELKQNKERFDLAIKAGKLGVWEYNIKNKTYIWDNSMYELFQTNNTSNDDPFELLKASIYHEDRETVIKAFNDAIKFKNNLEIIYKTTNHEGKLKFFLSKGDFIYDNTNTPSHMIGINIDITNEIEAKLDLQKTNQELENFAYVASHDLQEPLRVIASYLQIIESKYSTNLEDRGQQLMGRIVSASNRMKNLINDLLNYSRVNTKAIKFIKADLNVIVQAALEDLEILINEHEATIEVERLPKISCDPTQMLQVFMNLINNAIKYQKKDTYPIIKITSREIDQNHVEISFTDNGIGIDPEFHGRIFEIFQRLHTKEEYKGTGLGLAITKKIIERHKGTIEVESQLNNGSTFKIILPLN